jgi:hypothetical protein
VLVYLFFVFCCKLCILCTTQASVRWDSLYRTILCIASLFFFVQSSYFGTTKIFKNNSNLPCLHRFLSLAKQAFKSGIATRAHWPFFDVHKVFLFIRVHVSAFRSVRNTKEKFFLKSETVIAETFRSLSFSSERSQSAGLKFYEP